MGELEAVIFFRDRKAVNPAKPGTRAVSVLYLQRAAGFQLPGESES
jgi:hypothetical protein